jgi:hypothetical protein
MMGEGVGLCEINGGWGWVMREQRGMVGLGCARSMSGGEGVVLCDLKGAMRYRRVGGSGVV